MRPVLTCLSAYDQALVRELAGTAELDVRIASGSGDAAELAALVRDADLVIADAARRYMLDGAVIAEMTRCRFIQQPAVGYDSIDVAQAARQGIPVANAPGYNAAAVADWTVMAVLNVLRNGVAADAAVRSGATLPYALGRELGALTVGLIGMGAVARAVVSRMRGFGAKVVFTTRGPQTVDGARAVPLDDLLEQSDVVSLHVPLTEATRGMIGAEQMRRLKPGAVLVNSARGALVDQDALVAGLRAGRPAAAALDVFESEPLDPGSPLCVMPNVYLSQHIAAGSEQARVRVRRAVAANLRRVLAGQPPQDVVNGVR